MTRLAAALVAVSLLLALAAAPLRSQMSAGAAPNIVVDTVKGTFEIETYPNEAPRTVAHVVDLVRRHFYDGERIHRALPGFVVQFGDPQTRDLSRRELWGRGEAASSGVPIGVTEFDKKRRNRRGAVGIPHTGNPAKGDSQIYITLADRPDLDDKYVVFGQVVTNEDLPGQLEVGDLILRVYLKGGGG